MKITRNQLRRIVREESRRLNERPRRKELVADLEAAVASGEASEEQLRGMIRMMKAEKENADTLATGYDALARSSNAHPALKDAIVQSGLASDPEFRAGLKLAQGLKTGNWE